MEQKVTEVDLALNSLGDQVKHLTIQGALKDARIQVLNFQLQQAQKELSELRSEPDTEPEDPEDLDKSDV